MRPNQELLRGIAYAVLELEWGTAEQIEVENHFFDLVKQMYAGFETEHHPYLLKATTEEAIEYVFLVIGETS